MAKGSKDIVASAQKFAEALATLNAVSNQQAMQVLQIATLAMQIKSMGETDLSQAIIESKMAQQLNMQERVRRTLANPTEAPK